MAKTKKKKDSELYNGLSLFDFVSNEIEKNLDDLNERIENNKTINRRYRYMFLCVFPF